MIIILIISKYTKIEIDTNGCNVELYRLIELTKKVTMKSNAMKIYSLEGSLLLVGDISCAGALSFGIVIVRKLVGLTTVAFLGMMM